MSTMVAWLGIGLLVPAVVLLLVIVIGNPDWDWLEKSERSESSPASRTSQQPSSPTGQSAAGPLLAKSRAPTAPQTVAGAAARHAVAPAPGDQERLLDLLVRFEKSQTGPGTGGDALVRAVVLEIAQAGSLAASPVHARTNKDFLLQTSASSGGWWDSDRPWRWIAAITEEAERSGNFNLVAHAGLFTSFVTNFMAPTMTVTDYHDMRLSTPSDSARARVYSVALRTLPRLDQQAYLVRHNGDNAMQVSHVLACCALDALKVTSKLDDGIAGVARRVLGR